MLGFNLGVEVEIALVGRTRAERESDGYAIGGSHAALRAVQGRLRQERFWQLQQSSVPAEGTRFVQRFKRPGAEKFLLLFQMLSLFLDS